MLTRLGAPDGASIAADIATRLAASAYTAPPSAVAIDGVLTANHGDGSWLSGTCGFIAATVTGDTPVNHNTGGTDLLRYLSPTGIPVDNGGVVAYLKTAYDAADYSTPIAATTTRSDGRWSAPLLLDAGVTYTIAFYKQGVYAATTAEVTP